MGKLHMDALMDEKVVSVYVSLAGVTCGMSLRRCVPNLTSDADMVYSWDDQWPVTRTLLVWQVVRLCAHERSCDWCRVSDGMLIRWGSLMSLHSIISLAIKMSHSHPEPKTHEDAVGIPERVNIFDSDLKTWLH